jgi:hypothetical protein
MLVVVAVGEDVDGSVVMLVVVVVVEDVDGSVVMLVVVVVVEDIDDSFVMLAVAIVGSVPSLNSFASLFTIGVSSSVKTSLRSDEAKPYGDLAIEKKKHLFS